MKKITKWIEQALHGAKEKDLPVILDRVQWQINKALEDAGIQATAYKDDSPPPICPSCPPDPTP